MLPWQLLRERVAEEERERGWRGGGGGRREWTRFGQALRRRYPGMPVYVSAAPSDCGLGMVTHPSLHPVHSFFDLLHGVPVIELLAKIC